MANTSYGAYRPYKLARKNAPLPAYALLADLQNTTSHLNNSMKDNSGYGSVNTSTKPAYSPGQYSPTQVTSVKIEPRFEYSTQEPESPLYQNQRVVREVTITTTSSHTTHPPQNMSTLNNNLSELDTLLEDLNSARYADYADKKEPMSPSMNGPSSPLVQIPHHKTVSPSSSISSGGIQEVRPTVESLLDELQSAVPPSSSPPAYSPLSRPPEHMRVTTIMYKTTSPQTVTSTPAPTASSATKELDDLMASLSDFKVNASQLQSQSPPPPADSPYAKPNKPRSPAPSGGNKPNQLDSMLGTLQSDMSRQGVNTTQKGCCAACGKPIVGQVVTALAKTWHPEHFTCAHCNQELGTKNFFERDGRPYCEADYQNLFSPRCAYCNQAILDKCVTALEKTWHPEHFFCAQCGNAFGEDGFHEKDGKPYCRDDYFDMFAPKCGGCARPIMENYISALNSQWHPDCFVCRDCRQPFNGGSFFDHDGYPYCETHYHAKRGSLCAGCHKPITGRCITAMFRKFHPEHFVCSFCLKQLNKGTFKEQNDKPYCHPCFEKLFG